MKEKIVIRKVRITECESCRWHKNMPPNSSYSCACRCHFGGRAGYHEEILEEKEEKKDGVGDPGHAQPTTSQPLMPAAVDWVPGEGVSKKKRCHKCGKTKPLSEFGKLKRSKDGYDYCCRPCKALMARERYQKKGKHGGKHGGARHSKKSELDEVFKCSDCREIKGVAEKVETEDPEGFVKEVCKDCHRATIKE